MKALSPMIATVLLVAFVVGIGGILSLWLTGLTTSQTQTVSNQSNAQIKCTPSLRIDTVRISSAAGNQHINVTYTNIGSQVLNSVFVEAPNGTTLVSVSNGTLGIGAAGVTQLTYMQGTTNYVRVRALCAGIAVSATCDPTQTCWQVVV